MRFSFSFSDLLILGTLLAVLCVLARVIWGTPFVKRIAESFASGSNPVNITTQCPPGTQMFMKNGTAFCCSGTIDRNSDSIQKSCRPRNTRDEQFTFCSLGVSEIPTCSSIQGALMDKQGAEVCPPNTVFVAGPKGAKCCAAPNAERTDCLGGDFCPVADDSRSWMTQPNSCQFLKAQKDAGACPPGYGPFTASQASGITLFGCTDNGKNCYAASTLQRLQEMDYDITGLVAC